MSGGGTQSQVRGGTQSQVWGVPSGRSGGGTWSQVWEGVPIPGLGGTPSHVGGYPISGLGGYLGYPSSSRPGWGSLRPGWGPPLNPAGVPPDLAGVPPHLRPEMGYPPPGKCEQTENITFPILRMRAVTRHDCYTYH